MNFNEILVLNNASHENLRNLNQKVFIPGGSNVYGIENKKDPFRWDDDVSRYRSFVLHHIELLSLP